MSEAGITLADFEAAVCVVMNPPPGASLAATGAPPTPADLRLAQATAYIQRLGALPDAYRVCMQLLVSTSVPKAKFFLLQALEQYVRSDAYIALPPDARAEIRQSLIMWPASRGDSFYEEPSYCRNRVAVVVGAIIHRDFPDVWPTAFTDLIAAWSAVPATLDILLRTCAIVQQEVVDARSERNTAVLAYNGRIKDFMRDSGAVAALVDVWFNIANTYAATRPCLVAFALAVLAEYVSWIDIRLVVNDRQLPLCFSLLTHAHPLVCGGVVYLFYRLLYKGMSDVARLDLMRSLNLIDLVSHVMGRPDMLSLSDDLQAALDAAAAATPGEADAEAALRAFSDGLQEFGPTFAQLLSFMGTSLVSGGVSDTVLTSPEACTWTSTALRAVANASFTLLSYSDPGVGREVVPFIHEMVACFSREMKSMEGSGQSTSPSLSAMQAGELSLSRHTTRAMGSSGRSSLGTDGRPARMSFAEFIPRILDALIRRYPYPLSFDFSAEHASAASAAAGGGGDADAGLEDELTDESIIRELRTQLRTMFINIVRAAPDAVLKHLQSSVWALDQLATIASRPWNEAECVCALLYFYAEGYPSIVTSLRSGSGGFYDCLVTLFSAELLARPQHFEVIDQYFEVACRYVSVFASRPTLLALLFRDFLGACGLRNARPMVRSRAAYFLVKCVRAMRGGVEMPHAVAGELLLPFCDGLLSGVSEFLAIPLTRTSSAPTTVSRAFKEGSTGAVLASAVGSASATSGASGLGAVDQQLIFEVVGLLVGAPWQPQATKIAYSEGAVNPLVQQLEEGTAQLQLALQAAGTTAVPLDYINDVTAWLVRIINAIAHICKGLGNISSVEPLVALQERALNSTMAAVALTPPASDVRNRFVYLLHRMVDCLGARLLPHMPSIIALLLSCTQAEDMNAVLLLLNQVMHKYKLALAPYLAPALLPLLSRVFEVMPTMPIIATPPASMLQNGGSASTPSDITAEMTGAGDSLRARVDLQRSYTVFFQSMVQHGLVTEVLASEANVALLPQVVDSFRPLVSGATDFSVVKMIFSFFLNLLRTWLPVAVPTPAAGGAPASPVPAASTPQASMNGRVATAFPPASALASPAGRTGASAASAIATAAAIASTHVSGVALAGMPGLSPLSDAVRGTVVATFIDHLSSLPFVLGQSSTFHADDAQCMLASGEGIALLVNMAVHASAHSVALYNVHVPPADVLTHIMSKVVPQATGLSLGTASRFTAQLIDCLASPIHDVSRNSTLRAGFVASIVDVKASMIHAASALR